MLRMKYFLTKWKKSIEEKLKYLCTLRHQTLPATNAITFFKQFCRLCPGKDVLHRVYTVLFCDPSIMISLETIFCISNKRYLIIRLCFGYILYRIKNISHKNSHRFNLIWYIFKHLEGKQAKIFYYINICLLTAL